MKEISNPFSPGAGTPPPELAGRQEILETDSVVLQRVQKRKAAKSLLLTGLRGVGKTVLLDEINQIARGLGYQRIFVEAHEGKSLAALLARRNHTLNGSSISLTLAFSQNPSPPKLSQARSKARANRLKRRRLPRSFA